MICQGGCFPLAKSIAWVLNVSLPVTSGTRVTKPPSLPWNNAINDYIQCGSISHSMQKVIKFESRTGSHCLQFSHDAWHLFIKHLESRSFLNSMVYYAYNMFSPSLTSAPLSHFLYFHCRLPAWFFLYSFLIVRSWHDFCVVKPIDLAVNSPLNQLVVATVVLVVDVVIHVAAAVIVVAVVWFQISSDQAEKRSQTI